MADERREVVKSGQMILIQGEMPAEFIMLQDGVLEVLIASGEFAGLDGGIIASKSKRVTLIKNKGLVAGLSPIPGEPYRNSLRAASDCSIVRIPFSGGSFESMTASDPVQVVNVLRQLYSRANASIAETGKLAKLFQNISMISDNISLIYKELSQSNAAENLHSKAEMLHGNFISSGGQFPEKFGAQFLVADNSRFLSRRYEIPGESINAINRGDVSEFIKKLLKLPPKLSGTMIRTDPGIAVDMYRMSAEVYLKVLDRINMTVDSIDSELDKLFGESGSWSEYLVENGGFNEWRGSGRLTDDFIKNFLTLLVKLNAVYEEMTGRKMTGNFPGIRLIHQYFTSQKDQPRQFKRRHQEKLSLKAPRL